MSDCWYTKLWPIRETKERLQFVQEGKYTVRIHRYQRTFLPRVLIFHDSCTPYVIHIHIRNIMTSEAPLYSNPRATGFALLRA